MTLLLGDLRDVLPTLPSASLDACVCDPPYELAFMGKRWDSTGVAFQKETWAEVLRVLKPGGHLLAFGGSRTYLVGVERDPDYLAIAEARIRFWREHGEDALRIVADRDAGERVRAERRDSGQLDLLGGST